MKINQKGFSPVEGLLTLVIVSLIGFVSWYVWDSSEKSGNSLKNAEKSSQSLAKSELERINSKPNLDDKHAVYSRFGVIFQYPKEWKVYDNQSSGDTAQILNFSSPDYKTHREPDRFSLIHDAGAVIGVDATEFPRKDVTAENYSSDKGLYLPKFDKNGRIVIINGNKVFQYDTPSTEIGSPDRKTTIFFRKDGTQIRVYINYAHDASIGCQNMSDLLRQWT